MKQSLIKLVDVIIEKISERPDTMPSEKGIRSWLSGQGYDNREIEAAMKLIRPRLQLQTLKAEPPTASFRNFSSFEDYKLSKEAREAIIRLDFYQLITPFEREIILERLGLFESEVDLEELDYLLNMVLTERDVESQQVIYDVLEDKEDVLH